MERYVAYLAAVRSDQALRLYKPRKLLQVVGHTPMNEITREKNLISTDVFSTYRDGRPIGTQEFLLLDTVTWEYVGVKIEIWNELTDK